MSNGYVLEASDHAEAKAAIERLEGGAPAPAAPKSSWKSVLLWAFLVVVFVALYRHISSNPPPAFAPAPPEQEASRGLADYLLMVASGLAIAGTAAIIVAGRVGRRSRAPSFAAVREEGIELWRKGVAHVIGWQAIERVGDGVSLLMLKVDRKGWMGVPKRGFDPELSDEAVAEVRRRHEQGRTKDWPPLPAHEGEVRTSFRFERVEIDEVSRGMARAWLLRGRLLRRRPWRKGIWGVVLMVSALVGTASTAALGWIMLTVPFALILVFGFRATTAKGLSKQDKERQSTVSFEAAFDDRQFRYAWPGNRTSTDWEAVRGVWEGKTILLVWSNQMSYALPKRVLAAQDLERFRSLAARPVPNPS